MRSREQPRNVHRQVYDPAFRDGSSESSDSGIVAVYPAQGPSFDVRGGYG